MDCSWYGIPLQNNLGIKFVIKKTEILVFFFHTFSQSYEQGSLTTTLEDDKQVYILLWGCPHYMAKEIGSSGEKYMKN